MNQTSALTRTLAEAQETIFTSPFNWAAVVDDLALRVQSLMVCIEDASNPAHRNYNPAFAQSFEDWAATSAALLAHVARRMVR